MKLKTLAIAVFAMAASVAAQAEPISLKFSSVTSPTDVNGMTVQYMAEKLKEISGGEMTMDVYLGGALFSQDQETGALQRGLIDMSLTGFPWIATKAPRYAMIPSAYFFRDQEHMSEVLGGPIGKEIFEDIANKTGIRVLSAWYFGERVISYRDIGHDVRTPEDMKGVKLRMPNSESWMQLGRALGANPTPVSISELYLALSTGTVDAQDNPLPTTIQRKFYEVAKHITLTGHQVGVNLVAINEKSWEGLTPEQQGMLMKAADEGAKEMLKQTKAKEAEAVDFLEGQGVSFIMPDKSVWIDYAHNYYKTSGIMDGWDTALYDRVQAVGK